MNDPLGYVVLFPEQWDLVRDLALKDNRFTVHDVSDFRTIVTLSDRDEIVVDLGINNDRDYFWAIINVLGPGCSLLRNAMSIDTEQDVH